MNWRECTSMQEYYFTSQSRLDFDADQLLRMGVRRAFVTPFSRNCEALLEPERIIENLEILREKAEACLRRGLEVYPFFITINHPEGNFEIPSRYRIQMNLDGTPRPQFICFLDKTRQEEMIRFARKAAELGFSRLAFDDDLRDAFCYCDMHLQGFEAFKSLSREEIATVLNGVFSHPEHEQLRFEWYEYKRSGMEDYAMRLEQAVHETSPQCRIGICTSAKRCQDFSGRSVWEWAKLFHTDQAPVFVRLCGECYDDRLMSLCQSSGWHQYMNRLYPASIEKVIETTSVTGVEYRSPGTVFLEAKVVLAAVGPKPIHLCWTEDFRDNALAQVLAEHGKELGDFARHCEEDVFSPLAVYCAQQLGPYTPTGEKMPYGTAHDPVTTYNIIALNGIPVTFRADIPGNQCATISSGYIDRTMTYEIDRFLDRGGIVFIDAIAAMGYLLYGGKNRFQIQQPVSGHRFESDREGNTWDLIAEFPSHCVYPIDSDPKHTMLTGIDIMGKETGTTVACVTDEKTKGHLVVLGYDLTALGSILVNARWKSRLMGLLHASGILLPVHWDGSPAVQVITWKDTDSRVALANYNTHEVSGVLRRSGKEDYPVRLGPCEVKIMEFPLSN